MFDVRCSRTIESMQRKGNGLNFTIERRLFRPIVYESVLSEMKNGYNAIDKTGECFHCDGIVPFACWLPARRLQNFAEQSTLRPYLGSNRGRIMNTRHATYGLAAGVALAASFILVWLSLGVGIIGRDGDPANRMYFGVIAVGIIGALIARFRPLGMARALFAMALAQALVAVIALIAGLGHPWSGPLELSLLNGFFVALFAVSARLFHRAAQGRPDYPLEKNR